MLTLKYITLKLGLLVILLAQFSVVMSQQLLTVTNLNDTGAGSLRNAVNTAEDGDIIKINVAGTLVLQSPITIDKGLFIQGPMPVHFEIDGTNSLTTFIVDVAATISDFTYIDGIKFTGNTDGAIRCDQGDVYVGRSVFEGNQGTDGGAIQNVTSTDLLTIDKCSFIANAADNGGAIYSDGDLLCVNSTFYRNAAIAEGGAIYLENGTGEIIHNTLVKNSAVGHGGGVHNENGTITYSNNLFAINSADVGGIDPSISSNGGSNSSGGGNFFDSNPTSLGTIVGLATSDTSSLGMDPLIDSLMTDGYGFEYFNFISSLSPAIDRGNLAVLAEEDQRRGFRTMHGRNSKTADAGSIEYTPYCVTSTSSSPSGTGGAIIGSLGWAVDSVNLSPNGPYSICFDLPGPAFTINVIGPYRLIKDCIIDGYTQPGSEVPGPADDFGGTPVVIGSPLVSLNGTGTSASAIILSNGSKHKLRGLSVFNFNSASIILEDMVTESLVEGMHIGVDASGTSGSTFNGVGILFNSGATDNVVGDWPHHSRNVIANCDSAGVLLRGNGTAFNGIANSFIGIDATGMAAAANGMGVAVLDSARSIQIGDSLGVGNVISGNNGPGIFLADTTADLNAIYGNFIGTNVLGTGAIGNHKGVVITSRSNLNGIGAAGGRGNLISGNDSCGIEIQTWANGVYGNIIGLAKDGLTPLPNQGDGILLSDPVGINIIGTRNFGETNIISGNTGNGIRLIGASFTAIGGNIIGMGVDTLTRAGNEGYGILLDTGSVFVGIGNDSISGYNIIGDNDLGGIKLNHTAGGHSIFGNYIGTIPTDVGFLDIGNHSHGLMINDNNSFWGTKIGDSTVNGPRNFIGYNQGDGISIIGDDGNRLYANITVENSELGIDLDNDGVTVNDALDTDLGSNLRMNYPVISSASRCANGIQVEGTLNSEPNKHFRIEFFASRLLDASGHGESEKFLGFITDSTDASGNATFSAFLSIPAPAGWFVSATSTRQTGIQHTSELSAGVAIAAGIPGPTASSDVTGCAGDTSILLTATPAAGGSMVWAADPSFFSIIDTNLTIFADSSAGSNIYFVAESLGGVCLSEYDSVVVTLEPHLNPFFSFPDYCSNSMAILPDSIATLGGTFSFESPPPGPESINPFSGELSNVTGGNTYSIKYILPGACMDSSVVNVEILPAPVLDSLNVFDESCDGINDGKIEVFASGGSPPLLYSIDSGSTAQISSVFNSVAPGNYAVAVGDLNGCFAFTTTTIGNGDVNTLITDGTITTCVDFATQIRATGSGTILWSSPAIADSLNPFPTITTDSNTVYHVSLITPAGCVYQDSVVVLVDPTMTCGNGITVNAFSPDGDNVNDTWVVPMLANFPENTVTIYNRWGDIVAEFNNYNNSDIVWDGTSSSGTPLSAGTYYYGVYLAGNDRFLSGWVQLSK